MSQQPEVSRRATRRTATGPLLSGLPEQRPESSNRKTTTKMDENLKKEKKEAIKNFITVYVQRSRITVSSVDELVSIVKEIFKNYKDDSYDIPYLTSTISNKFKNQVAIILENTKVPFINSNVGYIVAEVYNEIILPKQREPIEIYIAIATN